MNDSPETPLPAGDEHDAVWRLLGQAPLAPADPWFTVRTLARCRYETMEPEPLWVKGQGRVIKWIFGGGLSVALAVFLLFPLHVSTVEAKQQKAQEAFEVMASLNTDSDPASSWQDSDSL